MNMKQTQKQLQAAMRHHIGVLLGTISPEVHENSYNKLQYIFVSMLPDFDQSKWDEYVQNGRYQDLTKDWRAKASAWIEKQVNDATEKFIADPHPYAPAQSEDKSFEALIARLQSEVGDKQITLEGVAYPNIGFEGGVTKEQKQEIEHILDIEFDHIQTGIVDADYDENGNPQYFCIMYLM